MTDNSPRFFEPEAPGTDNRHYLRQPIIAALDLDEDNGGVVVDMSEGGLRIQTVRELTADKFLDLRFQPWESNTRLEATGRIVWTNETKKFAGVQFISLPDQTREVLRGFLDKQTRDRAIYEMGANNTVRPMVPAESHAKAAAESSNLLSASVALPKFEIREIQKWTPAFILSAGSDRAVNEPRSRKITAFTVLFCLFASTAIWLTRSGNLSSSLRGFQRLISEQRGATQPIATVSVSPPSIAISPLPAAASSPPARDLGTVLQVAAMRHEENATAMVQSLKGDNFPAFVLRRGADPLYKVTVGPYADGRSIDAAKEKLAAQDIKFIEKRWLP